MGVGVNRIAIVTGASSGLGQEFVRQLDVLTRTPIGQEMEQHKFCKAPTTLRELSGDLCREWKERPAITGIGRPDEIWVLARRTERLEALTEVTTIPIRAFPCDLMDKESIRAFRDVLADEQPDVRVLINAAGYGRIGRTEMLSLEDVEGMVDLNCRAAVAMTQICLPYMQCGARILEICSIAAFQPLTRLNIYAASKAFLLHYSRALSAELKPRGITVTAVCPYWVKDTEFIGVAEHRGADGKDSSSSETDTAQSGSEDIHRYPLAGTRDRVVRQALLDASIGMSVSTPGVVSTLQRFLRRIVPTDLVILAWEGIRRV